MTYHLKLNFNIFIFTMEQFEPCIQQAPHLKRHSFISTLIIILVSYLLFILSGSSFSKADTIKTAEQNLPNIVFIWVDTLRADSLGFYGYERNTSPNIDQLAKESFVFMNNYTPHTVTLSSFMSIITGLYPYSHGVLYIAKDVLSKKIKTFAEILKMHGYSTSWFGPLKDPHLRPQVGFGRGFDMLDEFDIHTDISGFHDDTTGIYGGVAKVLKKIEGDKDKRFFINFHTYHVHSPFIPAKKYRYKFTPPKDIGVLEDYDSIEQATVEAIRKAIVEKIGYPYQFLEEDLINEMAEADLFEPDYKKSALNIKRFLQKKNALFKFDSISMFIYRSRITVEKERTVEYAKALYDSGIYEFDVEVLEPVITKLTELNLYEDSMIILCSDHGEEFGEHEGIGHGKSLYNEVTWVPLIIRIPGQKKGEKIEEISQTVFTPQFHQNFERLLHSWFLVFFNPPKPFPQNLASSLITI